METNGNNRFASQGVSIAQMMYVSKYKSHKIALFNSMKKSNIAPIFREQQRIEGKDKEEHNNRSFIVHGQKVFVGL